VLFGKSMVEPDDAVEASMAAKGSGVVRERLARASAQLARAGQMRRTSAEEAVAVWRALVAGRWTLVDHFDADGRRYLVARRSEPEPVLVTGLARLTPREREIVAFVALGHTNKLIAYELGLAPTTVATHLASASAKLGATTRIELVRAFEAARKEEPT
jgi:DNA-binding NarL/FixJ family response regulator